MMQADEFFTLQQIQRLKELMNRWRIARDSGKQLPLAQQAELEKLIEAQLKAQQSEQNPG